MQPQYSVENCIGLIYEAAGNSRKWQSFLEKLKISLNATAAAWSDYDFSSHKGTIIHFAGHDPAYVRKYTSQYAAENPFMDTDKYYQQNQICRGEEILSSEQLIRTPFYTEWMKPQHLWYRLCATVKREGSRVFFLEIFRSKTQGNFTLAEQRFIQKLMPHLEQAMKLNRYLWHMVVIDEVIEQQSDAIFIVDPKRRILFANHTAQQLLKESEELRYQSEQLRTVNSFLDKRLQTLIDKATTATEKSPKDLGGILMLPRHRGQQPLLLVISPLQRKLRKVIGQEDHVALIFAIVPEHVEEMHFSMLVALFGLTPAEERLLRLILEGYRLNQAADILNITHNTARSHMKSIYAKTCVERQVDLVRLFYSWNKTLIQYQDVAGA